MDDYQVFSNEQEELPVSLLKKARAKIQSPGGVLSNNVKPGQGGMLPNAIDSYRSKAADLYKQGSDLYDQEPDFSQFQNFAKQRSQQGEGAMLNALAAQYAGEGFAPVQEQYLKKAAAARDPMKIGSGIITADGQYLKDPEVAQNKKAEFLLQQAKAYETMAANAETARERIAAQRAQNEIQNQMRLMGIDLQRQGLALRGENAAIQRALAGQAVTDRKDKQLSEGTQKLSKQSEDLTNLVAGTRRLNDQLGLYAQKDAKNIPGVGYGSDINIMGLDVSGLAMGEEGKANRSMVKNVANELLRLASGQAVTLNEAQRQQLSNMASGSYSERDFLNAWENVILPKVNEAVTNVGAGYTPEIKERYSNQGGKIDFNRPFQAPARSKPQAGPSSRLSAQEQAELDALRSRYQRPPGERP